MLICTGWSWITYHSEYAFEELFERVLHALICTLILRLRDPLRTTTGKLTRWADTFQDWPVAPDHSIMQCTYLQASWKWARVRTDLVDSQRLSLWKLLFIRRSATGEVWKGSRQFHYHLFPCLHMQWFIWDSKLHHADAYRKDITRRSLWHCVGKGMA
jgi:hypothetical protein